jgi:hypothetical protein
MLLLTVCEQVRYTVTIVVLLFFVHILPFCAFHHPGSSILILKSFFDFKEKSHLILAFLIMSMEISQVS